jgi:hypothetical protein
VHELVDLLQRVLHHDHAGGLGSHVAVLADCDAHRRRHHGRGIVHAVADIERGGQGGLAPHQRQFLFGTLLGMHFAHANLFGQVTDLRLPIARDDHRAAKLVLRAEVLHERAAFGSRGVAEPQRRCVTAVDRHDALEAAGNGRDERPRRRVLGHHLRPAGNANLADADDTPQALTRRLGDLRRLDEGDSLSRRGIEQGDREGMLRVALHAGRQRHDLAARTPGPEDHLRQGGLAVGQRAGLVEDRRAAGRDLLEHDGTFHDDRAPRAQRDRANDGDWNRDQQRARCGDDQHGEEPGGVAAQAPRRQRDAERHGRIDRTEAIAEASQVRPALLRLAHHHHDFCEA